MCDVYQSYVKMVDKTAATLGKTRTEYEFSIYPEREIAGSIPVEMDDGTVTIFRGIRVQHSSLLGPYMGGLRLQNSISRRQVRGYAALMNLKCALLNLPFGGAVGGISLGDAPLSPNELRKVIRRYTAMVLPVIGPSVDIHSPDVGTNMDIMGWIMDTYSMMAGIAVPGIVTGKPLLLGGSSSSEASVGVGAAIVLHETLMRIKLLSEKSSAAVIGLGKVGSSVVRNIYEAGIKITTMCDRTGGVYSEDGLDVNEICSYTQNGGIISEYSANGITHVTLDEAIQSNCTILVTCTSEGIITSDNADKLNCKVILESGDAQITDDASNILSQNGVFVIPDLLATLGGPVLSYFEHVQNVQSLMWDRHEVRRMLKSVLLKAFNEVWQESTEHNLTLRESCYRIALARVWDAKRVRGIFP